MDNRSIKESLKLVKGIFPGAFITLRNELIVNRKYNEYMPLNDLNNDLDFEVRAVQCFSRSCCKGGMTKPAMKDFRAKVNELLGVDFNQNEWSNIYTYSNSKDFMTRFVLSGYNLNVIKEKGWHDQ